MASFEVQGVIHNIDETRTYGQNGFTKREFIIRLTGEGENASYPNYIAMELIKDKCALLDAYQIGDEIQVGFNLTGRLWNSPDKGERCFTSLQAWRLKKLSGSNDTPPPFDPEPPFPSPDDGFDQDIPF